MTDEINIIPPEKKSYPSVAQAFGLIGVLVLVTIVVGIPMELVKGYVDQSFQPLLNAFTYILSMVALLFFGIRMRGSFKFSLKKVELAVLLLCVPLILGLGIMLEPLIDAIPMPDLIKEYFNRVLTHDAWSFLMIAVAAPILEELVFRGIVLNGFLKRYKPFSSILLSALIFGIAHLNPWQFFGAFFIGLVIGWIYWRTNSLIPGMVIHFVNNSVSFLMMLWTGDNFITTRQLMGDGKAYYLFYGICIPVFIGSWFLIQQRLKMKETLK